MTLNLPEIKSSDRYSDFTLSREKLEYGLAETMKKVDYMMELYHGDTFPEENSTNQRYGFVKNLGGWGVGFYTGILWHAYEITGDEKYKERALGHIPSYYRRITERIRVDGHDMGFIFIPSCVASYKLTGDKMSEETAVMAAENLCRRFHEKGDFLQAWGSMDDSTKYRLIIDCLLNINILYWASEHTGDPKFAEIGYKHFNTTLETCFREDGSTFHTYYFDPQTGAPLKGVTAQGASDDSSWARGQTWGIYGSILTYMHKKDERALQAFKATTNYFLNHLPNDYVPFWDLQFTDGDDEPRDSSAAAIALCGILEGIKYMDKNDPLRAIYVSACNRIMDSLIDNYHAKSNPTANGLLLHAVYSKPGNLGVDEMNIWGCYFFMEALHRMLDPEWKIYW